MHGYQKVEKKNIGGSLLFDYLTKNIFEAVIMKGVTKLSGSILLSAFLLIVSPMSSASELTVAAANSTCNVMKKIGMRYQQQQGINIDFICKSSGRLAKGIIGKAISADIFISANKRWMDYMTEGGAVEAKSVMSHWSNSLVVAVPRNSSLELEQWTDLQSSNIEVIMIGNPGTAPFGRHAKEALQSTGIWNNVRNKIQTKKHITLLAEKLAISDAHTVGILFRTNISDDLKVIYAIDESWHNPIRYYMAPIRNPANKSQADSFLSFLHSSQVDELVEASGFVVVDR